MSARIRDLRDALVELVDAKWTGAGENDEVIAPYQYDIYAKNLTGRKVLVIPEAYSGFPANRAEDSTDYGFQLWVVERYTEAGDPPASWVDARVDFTEELEGWVGNPRRLPYFELHTSWVIEVQESGVTTVYDIVDLSENKLFIGVVTLLLREDAPAPPT